MKLLLASKSPRRKELLEHLGYDFQIVSIDCDESFPSDLPINEIAGFISEKKANAFRNLEDNEILLTSDTVVAFNDEILGKPKSEAEAKEMLKKLSGKTHQVYTGFTLKSKKQIITKIDVANVEFAEITKEEIDFYIEKFQPMDKAGSYGIQEWLGMTKITNINGSYYTIMGLPTHLIYQELQKLKEI